MIQNIDCSAVRGFNYQPSYARNGLDAWLDRFDAQVIAREIGLGKQYFPAINTLRLWLSFEAYFVDAKACLSNIETVIGICHAQGIRVIPVLFNGWHSLPDFGGISLEQIHGDKIVNLYGPYVEDLVGRYADDPRVALWDLCNEPFNSAPVEEVRAPILEWLTRMYNACKSVNATAPVTVSMCPSVGDMRYVESISDILLFHPYYAWNAWVPEKHMYTDFLDSAVEFAKSVNKPLLATECCWGSFDDIHRSEIVEFELSEIKKRGIGWTCHLLHHSQVADAHRRWAPGISAGYMAFIEADGSLRKGHEVYNKY